LPVRSNEEGSDSPVVDVSESESLKSEKYYLTSSLADGVLQQVEVRPTAPPSSGSPTSVWSLFVLFGICADYTSALHWTRMPVMDNNV